MCQPYARFFLSENKRDAPCSRFPAAFASVPRADTAGKRAAGDTACTSVLHRRSPTSILHAPPDPLAPVGGSLLSTELRAGPPGGPFHPPPSSFTPALLGQPPAAPARPSQRSRVPLWFPDPFPRVRPCTLAGGTLPPEPPRPGPSGHHREASHPQAAPVMPGSRSADVPEQRGHFSLALQTLHRHASPAFPPACAPAGPCSPPSFSPAQSGCGPRHRSSRRAQHRLPSGLRQCPGGPSAGALAR